MKELRQILKLSLNYRNYMTENLDIKGIDCKYIMLICKNPGITQDEIASKMNVDKSSVTRRLSFLEKKQYIERKTKKEDKRNLLCFPTEKAFSIYPQVQKIISGWQDYIIEDLTEEEKETLKIILDKMLLKAENWQEHGFEKIPSPKETER